MAKGKENTEYLKLASEIVNTMKEHIQNELEMNVILSETQKNVLNYINQNINSNSQNIEFKSSQEFDKFKKFFVDISQEKIDQSTIRLKKVLDDFSPENIDQTKNELDKIRVTIEKDREFGQKRLALAGEIANTMVEFIKNNNPNDGNLRAIGAQAAFLEKSTSLLKGKGKITLSNNQDFNKFKKNIDTFSQSVNSTEINKKIEGLVSAMGALSKGDMAQAQKTLESFRKDNPKLASKKSQKVGKKIKRAFESAKAKVSSIGSAVSNKVTEFKEGAKEKGKKWKDTVKTKVNSWRGRS